MFSFVLFSSSSFLGQLVSAMYFFSPHLNPSTRTVLRNFGIRIPPSQVILYQTVCIWFTDFFLLGRNSIASKSPWRQLKENTEDKTEAGVKNPRTPCLTLWSYYSRQWSFVITARSNSDFSHAMRSDERRLKLSCCIVRFLINATIQGFHRDEELMLKALRLFANHSPC